MREELSNILEQVDPTGLHISADSRIFIKDSVGVLMNDVRKETVALVISKLEEVLESKTDPKLIQAIVEDLKDAIYD
jgi:F0F1-type ATP synthase membrane subunit b/b'